MDKAYDELEAARKKVGGRMAAALTAHGVSSAALHLGHTSNRPCAARIVLRPQVTSQKDRIEKTRGQLASNPKATDRMAAEESTLQALATKLSSECATAWHTPGLPRLGLPACVMQQMSS